MSPEMFAVSAVILTFPAVSPLKVKTTLLELADKFSTIVATSGSPEGLAKVKLDTDEEELLPPGMDEDELPPGTDEDELPLPGTDEDELPLPGTDEDELPLPGTDEEELPPGTDEEELPPGTGEEELPPGTEDDEFEMDEEELEPDGEGIRFAFTL